MLSFGLKAEHHQLIKKVLATFLPADVEVLAFGSRARGDHQTYSDLDLALKSAGPVDPRALDQIRENLSQSSIPIQVEIVILHELDAAFRSAIQKELVHF